MLGIESRFMQAQSLIQLSSNGHQESLFFCWPNMYAIICRVKVYNAGTMEAFTETPNSVGLTFACWLFTHNNHNGTASPPRGSGRRCGNDGQPASHKSHGSQWIFVTWRKENNICSKTTTLEL